MGSFGILFGPTWSYLGPFEAILGPSWEKELLRELRQITSVKRSRDFGAFWGPFWGPKFVYFLYFLGSFFGPFFGHFLGNFWVHFGLQKPTKEIAPGLREAKEANKTA